MKIEIIPSAENDIKDIYFHILNKFKVPLTADRFLDGINQTIQTLKSEPNRGATYNVKYRKIFYKRWRIVYEVKGDTVYIIAVE